MKPVSVITILFIGALLLLYTGCTSGPDTGQEAAAEAPPDWVLNPPDSDEKYMYFTGYGTSGSGSLAEAEQTARGAVLDEIMRYLGVRITSETTATARASVDDFQTDVVQQLTSRSSGRVAGLEVAEKWQVEQAGALTLYLLARYDKTDLAREKHRLEEVFREKIEAVSGPELEAQELQSQGRPYQAAIRFLDAASAAFKSDLENVEIKFERNINQASEAIRSIGIVKLNDNLSTFMGKEFEEPFRAKVVNGSNADDPGVEGASVRVVYKLMRSSGRPAVRTETVKSDASGLVSFQVPAPNFVGREQVTMSLDVGAAMESLLDVPDDLYSLVEGFEQLVMSKKVAFSFESLSMASRISTGIAVFDLDASSNPIALTETSAGLLERLGQAGFQIINLPVAVTNIAGRPAAQVTRFLYDNFGTQVERAIFGTARISDHSQDKDTIIIQVTGTVTVVELESGKTLLTVNKSKRAQGTNTSTALSTAFKKLGEDMAEAIVNQLQ
ncbi:MAG: hypothetical protein JXB06_00225 [Spirochaetales bacterium]|nr:hypothetical protein [Spirochaetales bacterium]